MTYCNIDDVKDVLVGLDEEETEVEGEILRCINKADALINGILAAKEITPPSSPYPQLIQDASAWFAAYYFRAKREPLRATKEDVPVFMLLGREALDTWIASYHVEDLKGRGSV